MGKSKAKTLPECGTCEPLCPKMEKCLIPYQKMPSLDGMYINFGTGETFCKSVMYSNCYTTVTNSLHNFSGTVGVNDGIPTAVWNNAACEPYVNFPVPYYLREVDGNTKNNNIVILTSLYDGNNKQLVVTKPTLSLDSNTTVIGDVSDRFVKGVFPIFPITASTLDVSDTKSMFHYVTRGTIDIAVSVQSTKWAGQGDTLFTKIVEVLDVTNPCCKVPLAFTTFKLQSFGSSEDPGTPEFMTFIKNACCEFSVGLYHGLSAESEPGQIYPDDDEDVEYEWPDYNMVGAKGHGCPLSEPNQLTSLFATDLLNGIYATQSSMIDSSIANLKLMNGAVEVTPGNLTSAQKLQLVQDTSESLVDMWRDGTTVFNAFIVSLKPPLP